MASLLLSPTHELLPNELIARKYAFIEPDENNRLQFKRMIQLDKQLFRLRNDDENDFIAQHFIALTRNFINHIIRYNDKYDYPLTLIAYDEIENEIMGMIAKHCCDNLQFDENLYTSLIKRLLAYNQDENIYPFVFIVNVHNFRNYQQQRDLGNDCQKITNAFTFIDEHGDNLDITILKDGYEVTDDIYLHHWKGNYIDGIYARILYRDPQRKRSVLKKKDKNFDEHYHERLQQTWDTLQKPYGQGNTLPPEVMKLIGDRTYVGRQSHFLSSLRKDCERIKERFQFGSPAGSSISETILNTCKFIATTVVRLILEEYVNLSKGEGKQVWFYSSVNGEKPYIRTHGIDAIDCNPENQGDFKYSLDVDCISLARYQFESNRKSSSPFSKIPNSSSEEHEKLVKAILEKYRKHEHLYKRLQMLQEISFSSVDAFLHEDISQFLIREKFVLLPPHSLDINNNTFSPSFYFSKINNPYEAYGAVLKFIHKKFNNHYGNFFKLVDLMNNLTCVTMTIPNFLKTSDTSLDIQIKWHFMLHEFEVSIIHRLQDAETGHTLNVWDSLEKMSFIKSWDTLESMIADKICKNSLSNRSFTNNYDKEKKHIESIIYPPGIF